MSTTTTVDEKPILFRGEMVNAILEGRKTMTRRIVKATNRHSHFHRGPAKPASGALVYHDGGAWDASVLARKLPGDMPIGVCPYGSPGDRLWVRETWALVHWNGEDGTDDWEQAIPKVHPGLGWSVHHAADSTYAADCYEDRGFRWKPSIHMPRWACRLVLEITDVRVERLNDITPEDAVAEGIEEFAKHHRLSGYWTTAFSRLWDSINGAGSWAENPFVWVVSFRRIES